MVEGVTKHTGPSQGWTPGTGGSPSSSINSPVMCERRGGAGKRAGDRSRSELGGFSAGLKRGTLADGDIWRRLLLECGGLLSCYANAHRPKWTLNSQRRTGGAVRKYIDVGIDIIWTCVMQNRSREMCWF